MSTELFPSDLAGLHRFLCSSRIADEDEDDEPDEDETETVSSPAVEAFSAPRRRLHASDTPLALESPQAVEEPHQRRPEAPVAEPAPRTFWRRLFTGRAQLRDEDGMVIRTVMPGQNGYPHESEFVNWN